MKMTLKMSDFRARDATRRDATRGSRDAREIEGVDDGVGRARAIAKRGVVGALVWNDAKGARRAIGGVVKVANQGAEL